MAPARDLRDVLRRHGYTVYDIGNEAHMVHEPPEDHTPYSETAYPGRSVYGVGYAIDIMPPKTSARSKVDGLPLPSLQQLGAQLLADRNGGVSGIRWLKYMNWEPERNNGGLCYQESWRPTYRRRSSSDRGHIHLSGLTGYETSTIGSGYDPVARIRGDDMSEAEIIAAVRKAITTDRAIREELSRLPWAFKPADHGGKTTAHAIVLNGHTRTLTAIAGRDLVDEQQVAADLAPALLAVLTPQAIAAAVPAEFAGQVADELAARLAS
ncbi:hypothetical protein ABZ793_33980 [Micromonospora sp. NPDC047465]|uniref:hypothetical protein n=1 Tax=Micromonospora sp. NPDC047465 TaxID=3154813 RepID=UPI0033FEA561